METIGAKHRLSESSRLASQTDQSDASLAERRGITSSPSAFSKRAARDCAKSSRLREVKASSDVSQSYHIQSEFALAPTCVTGGEVGQPPNLTSIPIDFINGDNITLANPAFALGLFLLACCLFLGIEDDGIFPGLSSNKEFVFGRLLSVRAASEPIRPAARFLSVARAQ